MITLEPGSGAGLGFGPDSGFGPGSELDMPVSGRWCVPWDLECMADEIGDAAGDVAGDVAGGVVGGATDKLVGSVLDGLAGAFTDAASGALQWLWSEIDAATSVDLSDEVIRQPMMFAAAVALVVTAGLFLLQVVVSALRQDPGGLSRALKGMLIATIVAPAMIAVTQLFIAAVDALSTGVVVATTGQKDTARLGELMFSSAAMVQLSPLVAILVSLLVLVSTVMVWAALMVRKVLILITAVFAAIAFAGAASDWTSKWVRQVCEVMVALVISKFVMVVIFSMGYNMLVRPASGGGTAQVSTFGAGVVILAMAGLAPIAALKLVTFAGGMGDHLRVGSNVMRAPAQTAAALPRKAARIGAMAGATAATGGAAAARGAAAGGAAGKAASGGASVPRPASTAAGGPASSAGQGTSATAQPASVTPGTTRAPGTSGENAPGTRAGPAPAPPPGPVPVRPAAGVTGSTGAAATGVGAVAASGGHGSDQSGVPDPGVPPTHTPMRR